MILLIDEAQNLSKEVLEQLRLLSNLETNISKLLQIILVGQPELREILDSRELRQLSQRITLSCHLMPLTFKETQAYVHHRIQIASQKPGEKFTTSAIRAIYKYSSGIPRLINIASDRALLTAFGLNQSKVSGSIAKAAIRELAGRSDRYAASSESKTPMLIFGLSLIVLVFAIFQAYQYIKAPSEPAEIVSKPEKSKKEPSRPEPVIKQEQVQPSEKIQNLAEFLKASDIRKSEYHAMQIIADIWEEKPVKDQAFKDIPNVETYFRLAAAQNGLSVFRSDGTLQQIINLNLPAVLEIQHPVIASPVYAVLTQIRGNEITLKLGNDKSIRTTADDLRGIRTVAAYIVWKNFLAISGNIPREASPESVITLKMLLRDMGHQLDIQPGYDEQTRKIIEDIQKKHGLKADGAVGNLTKIVLYNEMNLFKIPHIVLSGDPIR
ncbi:MAG: AAA family ATPase [Desulfobacteraceae bacterium]|nr:AAA family ATPase [Desulfobacteraceae bacterium]